MATIFYKYCSINGNTKDSLEKQYFYYSQPSELNDPFDGKVPGEYSSTADELRSWVRRVKLSNIDVNKLASDISNNSLREKMEEGNDELQERYLIFCLSSVWNESLMWAHYAGSNSGICIGYNAIYEKNAFFLRLDLNNENLYGLERNGDCYKAVLVDIKYTKHDNRPYNPFKNNIDAVKNSFFSKEPKWSYEKEYRSILINTTAIKSIKRMRYLNNVLKEIIFGTTTSKKDMIDIYDLVVKQYSTRVKFYKIEIDEIKMILNRVEITRNDMDKY